MWVAQRLKSRPSRRVLSRVYGVWLHVWVDQRLIQMSHTSRQTRSSNPEPRDHQFASTVWTANCGDSAFASYVLGLHIHTATPARHSFM